MKAHFTLPYEAYLQTSIAYTLLNPVRAGMVKQPEDYVWLSFNDYFSSRNSGIVDTLFVE
jgi:putative transposase